ncbi:hypothetical protein [Pseudomonas sp. Pseu.R1]|uniref:hypothetical protein n=1 Tax=Pseudomonas sp. Pseu.R1 TaxID=3379818 RepID=UPI003B92E7F4
MAALFTATALNELSAEIVIFGAAQRKAGRLNEVGWRKLFNVVKLLGSTGELLASSLLMEANMHGIRGDAVQAKIVINKYYAIYGDTSAWYVIRASMARIFGGPQLISQMLARAFPHGNLTRLENILEICQVSGFYRSAYVILQKIAEIDPTRFQQLVNTMPEVLPAARYIEKHSLDEVKISERILALTKLVNDSGYMLRASRVLVGEFGIVYEVIVDEDVDKLVHLNFVVYDVLASQFDFDYSEHISVGVSPMENDHESNWV